MNLQELRKSWSDRKTFLQDKVTKDMIECPNESFAAIEELRKGPHGALLNVLHDEARLAELTIRLKELDESLNVGQ